MKNTFQRIAVATIIVMLAAFVSTTAESAAVAAPKGETSKAQAVRLLPVPEKYRHWCNSHPRKCHAVRAWGYKARQRYLDGAHTRHRTVLHLRSSYQQARAKWFRQHPIQRTALRGQCGNPPNPERWECWKADTDCVVNYALNTCFRTDPTGGSLSDMEKDTLLCGATVLVGFIPGVGWVSAGVGAGTCMWFVVGHHYWVDR